MTTKIISFDADGTVVDSAFVNEFWFEQMPQLYAEQKGISTSEARNLLKASYDRVGDEDLRWYQPRYWFDRFNLPGTPRSVVERIKENDKVRLYEDAVETIEKLSENYTLIVISNAPRIFLDHSLEPIKHKFFRIFSCVSDFERVKKNREVYKRVAETVRADPETIVHIGDHWKFDYEVPQEIGIRTFYIDRENEVNKNRGDGVINDLRQVISRID